MCNRSLYDVLEDRRLAKVERRKRSYRKRRCALIEAMGGKCVVCGKAEPEVKLEFNHLKPRTWRAEKTSRWVRIALYWREWLAGILDLRCSDCNKKAGRPADPDETPGGWDYDEIPP